MRFAGKEMVCAFDRHDLCRRHERSGLCQAFRRDCTDAEIIRSQEDHGVCLAMGEAVRQIGGSDLIGDSFAAAQRFILMYQLNLEE